MTYIIPPSKNRVNLWRMKAPDGSLRTRVFSAQKLGCKTTSTGFDFWMEKVLFHSLAIPLKKKKSLYFYQKEKIIKSALPVKRPMMMGRSLETLESGVEITRRTAASWASPSSFDSAELG